VASIPLRVRARIKEKLHSFQMPRAYREVNRLGVPVFRPAQAGIALQQAMKRGRVSGRSGSHRVPEVASFVRFKLARLNHFDSPLCVNCGFHYRQSAQPDCLAPDAPILAFLLCGFKTIRMSQVGDSLLLGGMVGPCFRLKSSRPVLEELLLPAVEDRGLESVLNTIALRSAPVPTDPASVCWFKLVVNIDRVNSTCWAHLLRHSRREEAFASSDVGYPYQLGAFTGMIFPALSA
jgi:hypothetical protein